MGIIKVTGIQCYAFHGCLDAESRIGSPYTVNIEVEADFSASETSDELTDTIDYVVIFEVVKKEMALRAKLIEVVARRIKNSILEVYPNIQRLQVEVIKHKPPMNGNVDQVSVII